MTRNDRIRQRAEQCFRYLRIGLIAGLGIPGTILAEGVLGKLYFGGCGALLGWLLNGAVLPTLREMLEEVLASDPEEMENRRILLTRGVISVGKFCGAFILVLILWELMAAGAIVGLSGVGWLLPRFGIHADPFTFLAVAAGLFGIGDWLAQRFKG